MMLEEEGGFDLLLLLDTYLPTTNFKLVDPIPNISRYVTICKVNVISKSYWFSKTAPFVENT